ncbi:unnamed protein product [Leuciscus chuanchicus]
MAFLANIPTMRKFPGTVAGLRGLEKHKGSTNLLGLDTRVAILLVFKGRAFMPPPTFCPEHRPFLRFAFQGQAFQFQVLPLGLSLAPRVFTQVISATLAPLQLRGIKILPYLDDWLICAPSREQVISNTEEVLAHIQSLEVFTVNWKKSSIQPQQQVKFLRLYFNSITMEACLTPQRIEGLEKALGHFQKGKFVTAHRVPKLVLQRIRDGHYTVLLVAPRWPERPWFPGLVQLIQGPPWQLPSRADLLSQIDGQIWYLNLMALRLWVPKSTVASIILKWKTFGTTRTLPRAGRPAKLSYWGRRALVREVKKNPKITVAELQRCSREMGESCSKSTITAAIHQSGLYGRVARRKPLLSARHMKAHLKDSKMVINKILWSDETKI